MSKGKIYNAEYRLISESEMQEREQKQIQKLQDISVSCNYIKVALEDFSSFEKKRAKREHWEHHLRCDGLPRPYLPPEIRTFLFRQRHFQKIHDDDTVDWTLSVDERSILTQNVFQVDNTRRTLSVTMNDNIGETIEKKVKMYINTLYQIEKMLGNQAEMARLTFEHQMEIMESRSVIEKDIENSFDYLTYRVIRMDGIYMVSPNARVATWNYKCELFQVDIWSLQDVSIRFKLLEEPLMMANLISSGVSVQMPLSVLQDRLTLRCIHTKFDKLSQNAKGYDLIAFEPVNYLNAGIVDIQDCLINEWHMQLEIQQEMIDKLRKKWEQYEEIMEVIAEKMEKAAKSQRNATDTGAKPHHIPKAPKQPLQLLPDMLPDPLSIFLDREHSQYLDFIDDTYHPSKMNLSVDEINLRQYIMLGGIYSIMFVRRPHHKHFQKFNVTLHEDGRILYKFDNLNETVRLDQRKSTKKMSTMMADKRSTTFGDDHQSNYEMPINHDEEYSTFQLGEDELHHFIVTIQLPEELCYWSEPIPCQFMASNQTENIANTSIIPEIEIFQKKKHKKIIEPPEINSRVHVERYSAIQRKDSEPVNIFRPSLISILRHSKLIQPMESVVPFENFVLKNQLNCLKLRKLEQVLLPRIISSFKFPLDIKEEREEDLDVRAKPQKGLLRIKDDHSNSNVEEDVDFDFDYDVQYSPERMFPIFSNVGPVIYPEDVGSSELTAKNTAYGLLNNIDSIKLKYMYKYRNISGQPDFELRKSILKKKLEDKEKVTDKLPLKDKIQSKKKPIKLKSNKVTTNIVTKQNTTVDSIRQSQNSYTMDIDHSSLHSGNSMRLVNDETTSDIEKDKSVTQVLHWTTKYIINSDFDHNNRILTITTNRLGFFGLAFKRYEHFPFQDWSLQTNEENTEEIVLRVDTFHVRVILYISGRGIRGYVTDITTVYTTKSKRYLEIIEPIIDFQELRQRFWEKNINIFPEHDACFYIDNGYFSIKHVAMEYHIYDAMALHCKLMKFYRSRWNRLATRRSVIISMKNAKDSTEYSEVNVHITPNNATFVEVSESCSNDLNVFQLEYKPTWRNIGTFTDLHQIINSMNLHANEVRNKDSMLLYLVKKMLSELRILSFS